MHRLHIPGKIIASLFAVMLCLTVAATASFAAEGAAPAPQEIAADVSCGKCGMYPAKFPQWQSQVIFSDGSMTPFDGCKCMFDFMLNMEKFDAAHSADQVTAVWVRDFASGEWTDGRKAHYVVGSDTMGPMGKELIPFADPGAAESFQKEHGGALAAFADVSVDTLKPLMGKMDMKGMKMDDKMKMEGAMEK